MADAPRRRGPKPKGPFENKRFRLSLRITEDTRRILEQAAADSGRSLMQEAELRLVQSFTVDETLAAARRMTDSAKEARESSQRTVDSAERLADAAEKAMDNARLMAAEAKSAMERADLAFDRAEKLLSRIPERLLSRISEMIPRQDDE